MVDYSKPTEELTEEEQWEREEAGVIKMVVTTDADLLKSIHQFYGHSFGSQLKLAKELQITPRAASHLTQEAGYHRHELKDPKNPVKLVDFIKKPYAAYIITKKRLKHEEES